MRCFGWTVFGFFRNEWLPSLIAQSLVSYPTLGLTGPVSPGGAAFHRVCFPLPDVSAEVITGLEKRGRCNDSPQRVT